jgi:peptidoglycan hydrolase CwlO-like protein
MKHKLLIGILSAAIIVLASGGSWSQEQQAIDCSTAKDDIATLKSEKKETDDKLVHGFFGYTPIGLIANEVDSVAHSDDQSEQKIKAYNKKLQDKIEEIKKTCDIQ